MTPSEALAHDAEQQRQKILEMRAGPELDLLVEREVFGSEVAVDETAPTERDRWYIVLPGGGTQSIRPYSTEAGAAMAVLEQFDWYDVKGTRRGNDRVITVTVGAFDQEGAFWVETTFPFAASKAALLATLEARPR